MSILSFLKRDYSSLKREQSTSLDKEEKQITERAVSSIYDICINNLNGEQIDLNTFKGKKILIVNISPDCSFSNQLKDIETLSKNYKDEVVVLGVPCSQFDNVGIEKKDSYYQDKLNVNFLVTQRMNVKGEDKHPLYKFLTDKKYNKVKDSNVNWNFQKYLISETGQFLKVWFSITKPNSVAILSAL